MEVFFRYPIVKKDQAHKLIILGRNKLLRSPFFASMSPHRGHGSKKEKKREGPVSLTFGVVGPSVGLTRWAISSEVERVPDNCVVVAGL